MVPGSATRQPLSDEIVAVEGGALPAGPYLSTLSCLSVQRNKNKSSAEYMGVFSFLLCVRVICSFIPFYLFNNI